MATHQKLIIGTFVGVMASAGLSVILMPGYSDMGRARREAVANEEIEKAPKLGPGSVRR